VVLGFTPTVPPPPLWPGSKVIRGESEGEVTDPPISERRTGEGRGLSPSRAKEDAEVDDVGSRWWRTREAKGRELHSRAFRDLLAPSKGRNIPRSSYIGTLA
jgi:hypothetical protein